MNLLAEMEFSSLGNLATIRTQSMEMVVHQLVQFKLSTFVKAVQASADTMDQ